MALQCRGDQRCAICSPSNVEAERVRVCPRLWPGGCLRSRGGGRRPCARRAGHDPHSRRRSARRASGFPIRAGRRAEAFARRRTARYGENRSQAVGAVLVRVVMASALSATAVATLQPHSQSRVEKSAFAGLAQIDFDRCRIDRHGALDGRTIENINRIRKIPPLPSFMMSAYRAFACQPPRLWDASSSSERQNSDTSSIMPCHRARRRRGHANAFARAQGHA